MSARISDRGLLDWLAKRAYVEATNSGAEDPDRFEWGAMDTDTLRVALSKHIRKQKRSEIEGEVITLQELNDRAERNRR